MDLTKPYKLIGFGDIRGPKPYEFIGCRWAFEETKPGCFGGDFRAPSMARSRASISARTETPNLFMFVLFVFVVFLRRPLIYKARAETPQFTRRALANKARAETPNS